jgi:hypothetical protein
LFKNDEENVDWNLTRTLFRLMKIEHFTAEDYIVL